MRRAVILTGALRTIKKTMKFFRRNILCHTDRHEIAVFACLQNDTNESDESWTQWVTAEIGPCLLDVTWFSLEKYPAWVAHRDLQLEHIVIDTRWKEYLRNSGSMIEYFQLQLAYMALCRTENTGGFRYDYVIRARTDSIYANPLDFHWLDWTENDITLRIERITQEMEESRINITTQEIFKYFICTMWSDTIIPNISFISVEHVPNPTESVKDTPSTAEQIRQYLHTGRYILTIRKNNLYVIRRDLFCMIPSLGTLYGFMRSPHSDPWWFNAEGQFRDACYYSCLSIFEYSSEFEERSLAYPSQWIEADFFDTHGELIHPRMVYCVVRK
jgi:hypothetical protein